MMRGRCAAHQSNLHIYFDATHIIIYFISLNDQKKNVYGNISYMKIDKGLVK